MDMKDNSCDDIAPLLSSLAHLRSVLVQCDTEFQLSEQVKAILIEYGANITESGISKHHLRSSLTGVGRYKEFFNSVSDSIPKVLLCFPFVYYLHRHFSYYLRKHKTILIKYLVETTILNF